MITSQGVKYAPTVKAANVVAGRTYVQQQFQNDASKVFTVLSISDDYQRNSMCAYRVARVLNAAGQEVEKQIAANQSYVEVIGG